MKFIVGSSDLLKHLQSVSGALNSNSPLPILENFLFEIDKNNLKISASDLETTMTTEMEITTKDKGVVAVPARILMDTLKTFSDIPLNFTVNDKNNQIEISSDNGKYKLAGLDGDEFPRIPVIEQAASIDIPSEILLEALNKTTFATGNDELRPVMSGVFFQLDGDNTTFVATDAHRLVRYRRLDIRAAKQAAFIVPKKPLQLLKTALTGLNSKVKIEFNEANAFFSFSNFNLICRLIDGKYPNYEAVIPTDNPNKMTIDRNLFLNAIRRISIYSNKTTHQVKLRIAGSELTLSAEDIDFNNEANENLSCEYEGTDMEIAFNARFLSDMLSNMTTEAVHMELSLPNRAGILTPDNVNGDSNEDVLMLVMPVMLS
jgi:DNA polymerase III subunit beta